MKIANSQLKASVTLLVAIVPVGVFFQQASNFVLTIEGLSVTPVVSHLLEQGNQ